MAEQMAQGIPWEADDCPVGGSDEWMGQVSLRDGRVLTFSLASPEPGFNDQWHWGCSFDTGEDGEDMACDAHVDGDAETEEAAKAACDRILAYARAAKRDAYLDPDVMQQEGDG